MAFFAGVAKNERDLMSRLVAHMTGAPAQGRFTYVGTGNGELIGLVVPPNLYGKLIEIECTVVSTGEAEFSVTVDAVPYLSALTNQPYSQNGLSFFISLGTTDFVLTDKFTIAAQGNYSFTNYDATTKPALIHYMGLPDGVEEDLTLTCTTAHTDVQDGVFSVSGSVSGALGNATVGQLFQSSVCNLSLPKPIWLSSSDNYEIGDTITIPLREGVLKSSPAKYQYQYSEYEEMETFTDEQPTWMLKNAVFKGSGNGGTETFYFSLERHWTYAKTIFWGSSGYNGYDNANDFTNQVGYQQTHQQTFFSLNPDEIKFWISVTGRRVVGVVKNGTLYEHFYLGLLLPHQAPEYYPNPLVIGGSYDWTAVNAYRNIGAGSWEQERGSHIAYFSARLDFSNSPDASQLKLYDPDGVVRDIYMGGLNSDGSNYDERYGVSLRTVTPYHHQALERLQVNFDGTYTPIPVYIQGAHRGGNTVYGRFDGIVGISGHNQAAENLLTFDNRYFLVFNNIYRTGLNDYCALEVK